MPQSDPRPVAVLGATGYVGARLVPRLLARGHKVRAISRSRDKLNAREWAHHDDIELAAADALDPASLVPALHGCRAVIYLVHSMGGASKSDFESKDRQAAINVSEAAARAGAERILYLGGLGEREDDLSPHLASRLEVADVLRAGPVPTTVLRAGVILGSGSASFDILRYLVERLPVMITPRWVSTPCQPIAIRNVLGYLLGCIENERTTGETFDLGGPDILTYRELMDIYAEEAGLRKRLVVPVPVLTPKLSSYWIHLVTPAPAHLARPLAEGLRNPVVVKDGDRIRSFIEQDLISPREAIKLALDRHQIGGVESSWTDAGVTPPSAWSREGDAAWTGGTILQDERSVEVPAALDTVWNAVVRMGGETGYYHGDWLWRTRGRIDKLVGGVGLRRGRRDAHALRAGDALDFWRVEAVEAPRHLRLSAEMRLPGDAVLEFELTPQPGGTRITQTARFRPRGLAGLAYWHGIKPLHASVFRGMLDGMAKAAMAEAASSPGASASSGKRVTRHRPS